MNAKKKIAKSIFSMISMVLVVVVALIFIFSMQDAKNKQLANAYQSYGVSASVSGNYYVGSKSHKMLSGEEDIIVFDASSEESSPALDPVGDIKLSSTNNFVVFEYVFTNKSDTISFVTTITNMAEVENMEITFGFSYDKLKTFETIDKKIIDGVPIIKGKGNTLYLYIKAKVENLNKGSSLIGSFCFSLVANDVYNLYLIDGEFQNKTYASTGYQLNDVKIPEKKGYKFEGYFTLPGGFGKQIFDENGHSEVIWAQESGDTLFAHYTKIK